MFDSALKFSILQAIIICTRTTIIEVGYDDAGLNVNGSDNSLIEEASGEETTTNSSTPNCSIPEFGEEGGPEQYRYFYNSSSETCEEFMYHGIDELKYFLTIDDCQESCPSGIQYNGARGSRRSSNIKCKLDVQLLGKCLLTANVRRIARCSTVPLRGKRADCLNAGCCWHHSYKICYQYVAKTIHGESCWALSTLGSQFYGVGRFRSLHRNTYGWIAYLSFSRPVSGSFCITKTEFQRNISIGEKLPKDLGFLLQENGIIYPGERVTFAFSGTNEGPMSDSKICVR